jgi:hypothetical protein
MILFTLHPLTLALSRLREREYQLLLPQAGEGWDEGAENEQLSTMELS